MSQFIQQHDFFDADTATTTRLCLRSDHIETLKQTEIFYQDDFISSEMENKLIEAIDSEKWLDDLRRRVQQYGYRYDYSSKWISDDDRIGDLPDWSLDIAERLVELKLFESCPDQLIVNEYMPGQGIAPHIDKDCFGPVVAAVSLGGDCTLKLYPPGKKDPDALDLVVLRRSLMAYRGIGRTKYRHGIAARKSDVQDGKKIPRERRISLTFRTVKHQPRHA